MAIIREMGGYVGNAPACKGCSLGSNLDISQKDKMGDISKGVVANKLEPAKKYTKKIFMLLKLPLLLFKGAQV